MFSSSKREAVAAVKRYGDSEYYKTVIRIVRNVNTFPSTRVEMIKDLKC